jgi:plastocyanin
MRRLVIACCAVVVGALGIATAGDAAGTRTVVVEDIDYKPGTVTVRKGTTVRWSFRDDPTEHNVRSRGRPRFTGSPVRLAGTHSVRFRRAGTYRYVCTLHPGMAGRVVVR